MRAMPGLTVRPLQPIPERGPALPPEQREEVEQNNRWWQQWYIRRGWRE
jgi:hypothetical protein